MKDILMLETPQESIDQLEAKRRRARKYLAKRGIAIAAIDSKFVYTDPAGHKRQPPSFLKKDEASVIELPRRVKS